MITFFFFKKKTKKNISDLTCATTAAMRSLGNNMTGNVSIKRTEASNEDAKQGQTKKLFLGEKKTTTERTLFLKTDFGLMLKKPPFSRGIKQHPWLLLMD